MGRGVSDTLQLLLRQALTSLSFRPMARRKRLDPEEWARWPDEKLLDLRFCDLDLTIENSPLAARVNQLYRELEERQFRFRPFFYLSNDWFTADGIPGVAIPFYLAHSRLLRLERHQMLEVEGGTTEWCMRILRHETAHVRLFAN